MSVNHWVGGMSDCVLCDSPAQLPLIQAVSQSEDRERGRVVGGICSECEASLYGEEQSGWDCLWCGREATSSWSTPAKETDDTEYRYLLGPLCDDCVGTA